MPKDKKKSMWQKAMSVVKSATESKLSKSIKDKDKNKKPEKRAISGFGGKKQY